MISLFNYDGYRPYIHARFKEMPKAGHGQSLKLAGHLGVHTTLVSQVLKGIKSFTLEQASLTTEFLELTENETEYFLLLVQLDRAGNESLRKNLRKRLTQLKRESEKLDDRVMSDKKLSEELKAVYYSDWVYSAVRQLIAIKGFENTDAIAAYLGFPAKRVKNIVEFLLKTGLCVEEKGKLKIGVKSTHLEQASPWSRVHHVNWRQRAVETLHREEASRLHYTCPMTLSAEDAAKLREMILKFLEGVDKIIEPSVSEELHCLNIDWFKI